MYFLDYLVVLMGVLIGVAFFTLMERKILGLSHYRKGPTKLIVFGFSQPLADAVKLMVKEYLKIFNYKNFMFLSGPLFSILLMVTCWSTFYSSMSLWTSSLTFMLIMCVMSLLGYSFILTSWGSNSLYSLLGGYRSVSQMVSYEVCLILFFMVFLYLTNSFNFMGLIIMQNSLWFLCIYPPLFFVWCLLCMAESNRTPFDLSEGESEIVSGFNVEYGGGLFALIFISEYGMIMFMSFLTSLFFLGGTSLIPKIFLFSLFYVWVRCSFPRVRYNNLMMMGWKLCLPLGLGVLMLIICL